MSHTVRHALLLGATLGLGAAAAESLAAQQRFTLADVAPMTGCWLGDTGRLQLREQWTDAEGGVMLGNTRFFRDGVVVDWEFGRIVEDPDGVVLWPYPRGTISADGFRLVREVPAFVFENLEHDFPVRIIYTPSSQGAWRVRIEGADGRGQEWSIERVPCP